MAQSNLTEQAHLVGLVASEAADEPDAIARHPEVVEALHDLAEREGLTELFGANGHDPAAFINALAEGLSLYRQQPLTDAPELVEGLAVVAQVLERGTNGNQSA